MVNQRRSTPPGERRYNQPDRRFAPLKIAVDGTERSWGMVAAYEKINCLMLMMVDPDVDFNVIAQDEGVCVQRDPVPDGHGPARPALGATVDPDPSAVRALAGQPAQAWPAA